jgi:hypothetical protein
MPYERAQEKDQDGGRRKAPERSFRTLGSVLLVCSFVAGMAPQGAGAQIGLSPYPCREMVRKQLDPWAREIGGKLRLEKRGIDATNFAREYNSLRQGLWDARDPTTLCGMMQKKLCDTLSAKYQTKTPTRSQCNPGGPAL